MFLARRFKHNEYLTEKERRTLWSNRKCIVHTRLMMRMRLPCVLFSQAHLNVYLRFLKSFAAIVCLFLSSLLRSSCGNGNDHNNANYLFLFSLCHECALCTFRVCLPYNLAFPFQFFSFCRSRENDSLFL